MVRRTKLEAAATRDGILDAAEQLFCGRGVSRTSLQDIATAAGVTRGAIYWHFADKADLFNAMMERATVPFEQDLLRFDPLREADPLAFVEALAHRAFDLVEGEPNLRRVLEIAMHKAEYVDELLAARDHHLAAYDRCVVRVEQALKIAADRGLIEARASPRVLAVGLWALIDGLLQGWLLQTSAFDLRQAGRETVRVYLAGLKPPPSPPVSRRASAARRG